MKISDYKTHSNTHRFPLAEKSFILPNLNQCRTEILGVLSSLPYEDSKSMNEILTDFKTERKGKIILDFTNYMRSSLRFASGYNYSLLVGFNSLRFNSIQ